MTCQNRLEKQNNNSKLTIMTFIMFVASVIILLWACSHVCTYVIVCTRICDRSSDSISHIVEIVKILSVDCTLGWLACMNSMQNNACYTHAKSMTLIKNI